MLGVGDDGLNIFVNGVMKPVKPLLARPWFKITLKNILPNFNLQIPEVNVMIFALNVIKTHII